MASGGMPYGLQAMLKEGYTHTSGMSEAVYKNLEACKELAKICRTSLGPNGAQPKLSCLTAFATAVSRCLYSHTCASGMNKIVINHLDKTFVTSDASVMMTELEVQHPAAKLVVMAAKAQESEVGDATNLVRSVNQRLAAKTWARGTTWPPAEFEEAQPARPCQLDAPCVPCRPCTVLSIYVCSACR
jgi:T-complex protein 1 subunit theta